MQIAHIPGHAVSEPVTANIRPTSSREASGGGEFSVHFALVGKEGRSSADRTKPDSMTPDSGENAESRTSPNVAESDTSPDITDDDISDRKTGDSFESTSELPQTETVKKPTGESEESDQIQFYNGAVTGETPQPMQKPGNHGPIPELPVSVMDKQYRHDNNTSQIAVSAKLGQTQEIAGKGMSGLSGVQPAGTANAVPNIGQASGAKLVHPAPTGGPQQGLGQTESVSQDPQIGRTAGPMLQENRPYATMNPPIAAGHAGSATLPESRAESRAPTHFQALDLPASLPTAVPAAVVKNAPAIPAERAAGMNPPIALHTGSNQVFMVPGGDLPENILTPMSEQALNTGTARSVEGMMARPEAARLVGAQMAEAIVIAQNNKVEIALNPEELGRVRMVMSTSETGISIAITAERPETLDMMRRHIDQLAAEFRNLGYKDINFDFAGGDAQASFGNDNSGSHRGSPVAPDLDQDMPKPTPIEIARASLSRGLDLRL